MAAISVPSLSSTEARAAYEAEYDAVFHSLPDTPPRVLAQLFVRLDARLDAGMTDVKTAMLVPSLLTSDEDQALGRWIHRQHAQLARLGCEIVVAAQGDSQVDDAMGLRLVALSLMHLGEAVKWELIAGRAHGCDHAALHELVRFALERGWLHSPCTVTMDGIERQAMVDALYFRALLLDRFANGSLSRQQVDVLDAFLWEWTPWLMALPEPAAGVMRADLDSDHGLRYGARSGPGGPCLYLSIAALETQRQAVIEAFHAGRVVPARGRAAEIRLEAHVAVLEQLRRTFGGDDRRAPREPVDTLTVEAWVGLQDIAHALALDALRADEPAPSSAAAPRDRFDEIYEQPRRWIDVVDASDSGWLLEAHGAAAAGLVIGELVALRFHAGAPCLLACVVRCVRRADEDIVDVGLERLSEQDLPMRTCLLRTDSGDAGTYIFVPGGEASGRHDAFVVPYRLLESGERFLVKQAGRDFALAFNRVRRRGRGWALAGYEMVDASTWEIIVA